MPSNATFFSNRKDVKVLDVVYFPFVDAYRTLCFDPPNEVRETFEALRCVGIAG